MTIEPWVVVVLLVGLLFGGAGVVILAAIRRRRDHARLQQRLRQDELIERASFKQEMDDLDGVFLEDHDYES